MEFKGKKVTVVGMARSGVSAAVLLKKCGGLVTVTDAKKETELFDNVAILKKEAGIIIETGGHTSASILEAELLVVSPGIDTEKPGTLFAEAKAKGIEIIGELELAYLFMKCRVCAVTGTKGKTTTTTLIGEIFKRAGIETAVGGNIGYPLTGMLSVLEKKESVCVAEVSSFQLETIKSFRPGVAAILNIGSDHMDRYKSLQQYVEAKGNIFKNQTAEDALILNQNDKFTPLYASQAKAKLYYVDSKNRLEAGKEGAYLEDGLIVLKIAGRETAVVRGSELIIKGLHNVENAMVAALFAGLMGIQESVMAETLKEFKGVEHRQELAGEVAGIQFINNSQGTNMLAVEKSLLSYEGQIVLIAGGRNKNSDFRDLKTVIGKKVKKIIVIGEAKEEIKKALSEVVEIEEAVTLQEAVEKGYKAAVRGDIVMLSPGCASFDMFKDYQERGQVFKAAVVALKRDK